MIDRGYFSDRARAKEYVELHDQVEVRFLLLAATAH